MDQAGTEPHPASEAAEHLTQWLAEDQRNPAIPQTVADLVNLYEQLLQHNPDALRYAFMHTVLRGEYGLRKTSGRASDHGRDLTWMATLGNEMLRCTLIALGRYQAEAELAALYLWEPSPPGGRGPWSM